jgi:Major tropism determinant N-terminal domain
MAVTIQLRRETAANWTAANSVLHQGEMGVETDTGKFKFGDGVTAWNSLSYWSAGGIDGTASDIQPSPGTRAAGSVGKSADAGHVHGQPNGLTLIAYLAPAVVTLTFVGSGTTLVNAALGNAFALTLTASTTTLGAPSNPVDGQAIRVRVIQGGSGSYTLAYNSAYDFGAAGSPTLSTSVGKVDILGFEYVASLSKWCYLGSGLGF